MRKPRLGEPELPFQVTLAEGGRGLGCEIFSFSDLRQNTGLVPT